MANNSKNMDALAVMRCLNSDSERVKFMLQMIGREKPVEKDRNQKSDEKACNLREEGNVHAKQNNPETALSLYTQSLAFAPPNSQALPLAFSNRAAMLKSMGHFADSIADTQRALKTGYPENQVYKLYLRQGICYQNLGQDERTVKSFNKTLEAVEKASILNEEEKEKIKLDIECKLKYLDGELEEEFKDLTCDKSIGVLNFEVPSLGSKVNPEIPTASDSIALKYNKICGRHLVATRDIEPGKFGENSD